MKILPFSLSSPATLSILEPLLFSKLLAGPLSHTRHFHSRETQTEKQYQRVKIVIMM